MLEKPTSEHMTKHQQMARQSKGKAGSEKQSHGDQQQITKPTQGGTKMMSPVK